MTNVYIPLLNIPTVTAGDVFGYSLSINEAGDIVAVGTATANAPNTGGYVRVYQWNGSSWVTYGQLLNSTVLGDSLGTSVAINAVGDVLAVGAPSANTFIGYVKIYKYNGTLWILQATFNGTPSSTDAFGTSLSLNAAGDLLAIGAPNVSAVTGYVKVYKYNGSSWSLRNTINGISVSDTFGTSVSQSPTGNLLAVGAPAYNSSLGCFRVYKYNDSTLVWDIQITGFGTDSGGQLGTSISISTSHLAVSAPRFGVDKVKIYKYNGSSWINNTSLLSLSGTTFGYSLSLITINGISRLAVGAPQASPVSNTEGSVFIYENNSNVNNLWNEIGTQLDGYAPKINFGTSVALNSTGSRLAISAPFNDAGDLGRFVSVFQWNYPSNFWTQQLFTVIPAATCFIKGMLIETDQEIINIELVDPSIHTINKKKIVALTETVSFEPNLIKISKGSLGINLPTQDTIISNSHKIFLSNDFISGICARDLVGKYEGIYKVPYIYGTVLYNILQEKYSTMKVNGLLVETLEPSHKVAELYIKKPDIISNIYNKYLFDISKKANEYHKNKNKLINVI